jgi:hypothetical protein
MHITSIYCNDSNEVFLITGLAMKWQGIGPSLENQLKRHFGDNWEKI